MSAEVPPPTKFAVDAMLGSLARKLRAFGFDTAYHNAGSDSTLLAACARQGRVLVTADRLLAARALRRRLPCLLVTGRSDRARLLELTGEADGFGIGLKRGEPRCSLCNGSLVRLPATKAKQRVPGPVAARHRVFFACADCGQVYWKGGHWKKLRRLEALVQAKPRGSR